MDAAAASLKNREKWISMLRIGIRCRLQAGHNRSELSLLVDTESGPIGFNLPAWVGLRTAGSASPDTAL